MIEAVMKREGVYTIPATNGCNVRRRLLGSFANSVFKVGYIGHCVECWYLNKIEAPTPKQRVAFDTPSSSVSPEDVLAFVGEDAAELCFAQVLVLISMQECGLSNLLLKDKVTNAFFVRDEFGVLRLLRVHYFEGVGWSFYSNIIGSPYEVLGQGSRVFYGI